MTMHVPRVLDARVSGRQFEIPQHSRVEALTVASVLKEIPPRVYYVEPDAPSLETLKFMEDHDFVAVPVVEGGRLLGIFSEHDYARSSARIGQSAANAPVCEAMTSCDVCVEPADSAQTCLNLMSKSGSHHVAVRDGGKVVAMLSLDDLLGAIVAHHERVVKATELDQQLLFLSGTYSC